MNLMDLLKDQVLGKVAGQLGNHLGESEESTKGGLDALLPTVLGGLMKKVSEPGGGDELATTLDQDDFDGGLLDNISGMLSGDDSGSVSEMGGGLVKMLFGDNASSIIGMLSKFTGMGDKSTSSLLGLALPLIMSFLGKQKRSMGLDSNGLTDMLVSQKDHIAGALPPGIGDAMGLGALGISGPEASAPAASSLPATSPASSGQGGGGLMKLVLPLIILAALGLLAYNFLGGGDADVNPNPAAIDNVDGDNLDIDMGVPEVAGLADATKNLKDSFTGLGDLFGKITDVDSAKANLDGLKEADAGLGKITSALDSGPEGLKTGLLKVSAGLIPGLQETIDKVMAIPGVGEVLKPVVDGLKEKLGMLSA